MVNKGNLAIDPRGLIFEAYRIDGIRPEECRSIFLDWALGQPVGTDMQAALTQLHSTYGAPNPDHPMTAVISEGLARAAVPTGRRRGRARRG